MNSITNSNMKLTASFISTLALLAMLGGCDSGNELIPANTTPDSGDYYSNRPAGTSKGGSNNVPPAIEDAGGEKKEYQKFSYELPEGWEGISYDTPLLEVVKKQPVVDVDFSKISFEYPIPGTDEDSYQLICGYLDDPERKCEGVGEGTEYYQTLTFGDIRMYVSAVQGGYMSDIMWYTRAAFSKDGILYVFSLGGDKIETYKDELETIIKSITVEEEQTTE